MIVWDDGTKKQRVYEMWEDNFHDPVSLRTFILMKYMEKMKFC